MNDYKTLMAYIQSKASAIAPDPGESYRDLKVYFDEKLSDSANDRDDVRLMAKRALGVVGLDKSLNKSTTASTLNQPTNAHKRACAATLLAMSIIRDTGEVILAQDKQRLLKMKTGDVESELMSILKKGDISKSKKPGCERLELKNFSSGGAKGKLWRAEVEEAYLRMHGLLLACDHTFASPAMGWLPQTAQEAFKDYFGDPDAVVNTSTLPFNLARPHPTWGANDQKRITVARDVLRRVCRSIVNQNVRIYLGGRGIDAGTVAYVSGDQNPTKIHVGGRFFTRVQTGLNSEAGTLVHECTHTFAGTKDHKYGSDNCKQLSQSNVLQALSNADSYKFFVETAFG